MFEIHTTGNLYRVLMKTTRADLIRMVYAHLPVECEWNYGGSSRTGLVSFSSAHIEAIVGVYDV